MKYIFFGAACAVFLDVCIIGILAVFIIAKKDNITVADIGVALTGFGSVLSSIIVLPQIIAKHLFPENSEEVRDNFIKGVQEFDQVNVNVDDLEDLFEDEIDEKDIEKKEESQENA